MRSIVNLAIKDLRLLVRDKAGLFWVAAFPLLMALFFGSIFGFGDDGARKLRIATVEESVSPLARQFYDNLSKSEAIQARPMSRDSARLLVSRGTLVAYVEFVGGGQDMFSMFSDSSGSIEVGIDPSRRAEAGYLNGLISQSYFQLLQGSMMDTDSWRNSINRQRLSLDSATTINKNERTRLENLYSTLDTFLVSLREVDKPAGGDSMKPASPFGNLKIKFTDIAENSTGPRSAFEVTFPQSLQWALIGCAAAFALSIVTERTRGTFMRLRLAPISQVQILAGKGLACFLASATTCVVLLLIGILIFKIRVASPIGLVVAVASSGICFVGLMMLMSVLGKTEASVSGSGWGIFMVFSMTGGGMVPLMFMPSWMASLSNFSPVKWSILAAEGAIWRGFGFSEMLLPVCVLIAIGLVGFSTGVYILKRSDG